MASSSIGLPSCPELNPRSIQESDKCSFLGEGEKLGSSLFKEEPSPRDAVEPIDSKSKKELSPQTSGQAMALQVPSKLHQVPAAIRSMKAADHYPSLDNPDYMLSSLEPEDEDEVPHFIRLYRPMIVKCVDCVPLLPQLRDIIDSQGTHYFISF